ncbi:MAG: ABC transporter substrate-binding protein [Prevotella ruminicola]|jgi:iron complex transport system substrate-binding protein|uniref:ABC transporter substrate-binding protein n=1 Tax=Xylanibacter ruminicola TaxID=839 RepID=A0A9D5NYC1_XYLRU|nr:ABC transporter substrate-binding protein [Xylanibacter ruminicola]
MKYIQLLIIAVLLTACGGAKKKASQQAEGDAVAFKYATQISIEKFDGYTVATIKNPWKEGMVLHRYVMIPADQEVPNHIPSGTIVRTPLKRAVMFTTMHCAMLMEFGKQSCISGVADLKYIKIPWIQEQVAKGRITDVGDGMSPVIEKIIDEHPDALFLSPFENSGGYGKLEEINIPIIECADYMEASPLARAEWLRFYGMLFGCEERADMLFQSVDNSYQQLKALAAKAKTKPSVLVDKVTGSVWYVPGGKSTIGQMIKDANGQYAWADDEHSGSISLPFETVLERAGDADVWLFRYSSDHDITYDELLSEHHGYNQINAFKQQTAYGCNVENSLFYEESPFHPERLLGDFIHILHPELEIMDSMRYFKAVNR